MTAYDGRDLTEQASGAAEGGWGFRSRVPEVLTNLCTQTKSTRKFLTHQKFQIVNFKPHKRLLISPKLIHLRASLGTVYISDVIAAVK